MITLKSKREIEIMRDASRIVAEVLDGLRELCRAGVTTAELDAFAEKIPLKYGATPAFKGYRGFPGALCASVNQQVVHGIPGGYTLKEGDIISLDFGVHFNGYYGDAALTLPVGSVTREKEKLLKITEESLYHGIEKLVPGNHLSDLSYAIQSHAESNGFSLVKEFGGHGIGRKLHEDPMVLNYVTNGRGVQIRPGLVLAIEPMVNAGVDSVRVLADGWTVVTEDGKASAHFEHTVAVTENGPDILTSSLSMQR
ncbi:MAG: type I methionyl aminopeptidase [Acidobacteriota bacterium]